MVTQDVSSPPTNGHLPTENQLRLMQRLVTNVATLRRDWYNRLTDPRRDVNAECGFPEKIDAQQYQDLYDRHPIAARVVEVWPSETWQVQPTIYEEEDSDEATEFEQAIDDLPRMVRGEQSHYQDEKGSPLMSALAQVDEQSGIGTYGALLFGFNDVTRADQLRNPVRGVEEKNSAPRGKGAPPSTNVGFYSLTANAETRGRKLLFLEAFPESLAPVVQYETNMSSPRHGQPTMYQLTLNDPDKILGTAPGTTTVDVHWTRILHVSEKNKLFSPPRMQTVFNHLYNLTKIYGAAGEGFWRGAVLKYFIETHPQLGGDVVIDREAFKDEWEKFATGLQSEMGLVGMSAKAIPPSVVDPTPHVNAQIEAICIKLNIPIRIFMGSERGELASSQDQKAWNKRVKGRQDGYVTPRIIVPFVDRLIMVGVLPTPKGYSVDWPDIAAQTDEEKAKVFQMRMAGWSAYVAGGVEAIIPPREALTLEGGYTDEEADAILEAAAAAAEEGSDAGGAGLLGMVGGITGMIELFKLAHEGGLSEDQLKQQIMLFFRVTEEVADKLIADGLTPAAEEAADPTPPDPETIPPMAVKQGEKLVDPSDGAEIAKGFPPKPSVNVAALGRILTNALAEAGKGVQA